MKYFSFNNKNGHYARRFRGLRGKEITRVVLLPLWKEIWHIIS